MVEASGFEVHPGVLSDQDVATLLAALMEGRARTRAGMRHLMGDPVVAGVAHNTRLVSLAERVLGSGVQPYRATLFDKSAAANWLVVWHQDTALPLRARREVPGWGPWSVKAGITYAHAPASALEPLVALRIHLDDSLARNGPLRVLPGSHTIGVLSDRQIHDLAERIVPYECVVPRGGVLSMRPLLVHASSKSTDGSPRRVLHIEYTRSFDLEYGLEIARA